MALCKRFSWFQHGNMEIYTHGAIKKPDTLKSILFGSYQKAILSVLLPGVHAAASKTWRCSYHRFPALGLSAHPWLSRWQSAVPAVSWRWPTHSPQRKIGFAALGQRWTSPSSLWQFVYPGAAYQLHKYLRPFLSWRCATAPAHPYSYAPVGLCSRDRQCHPTWACEQVFCIAVGQNPCPTAYL